MTDELSGEELDKALALAMGWTTCDDEMCTACWYDTNGHRVEVPPYHESIDLLLRDVWPVAQARGAQSYTLGDSFGKCHCAVYQGSTRRYLVSHAYAPSGQLALAFARALLVAVRDA